MKVNILRKKDNKIITYKKVSHVLPASDRYGNSSFGLYWWSHLHENIKKDVSKYVDVKRYALLGIIDNKKS